MFFYSTLTFNINAQFDICLARKKNELDAIIRASEYFELSRTAHNRLREDFEFPSIETLTRLSSKVKSVDDDNYLITLFN